MPQSIQQIAETVCRASASFKDVEVKNNEVKVAKGLLRGGTNHDAVVRVVVQVATRDSVNADTIASFATKIMEHTSRGRMFAHDFAEASRILSEHHSGSDNSEDDLPLGAEAQKNLISFGEPLVQPGNPLIHYTDYGTFEIPER